MAGETVEDHKTHRWYKPLSVAAVALIIVSDFVGRVGNYWRRMPQVFVAEGVIDCCRGEIVTTATELTEGGEIVSRRVMR